MSLVLRNETIRTRFLGQFDFCTDYKEETENSFKKINEFFIITFYIESANMVKIRTIKA